MKTNSTLSKVFFGIAWLLSFFSGEVMASHFRGGILSWSPVGPDSARFVLHASFTRTEFHGSGGDGFAVTGDKLYETVGNSGLNFGDLSTTGTLRFQVISYDLGNNMITAVALEPSDSTKQSIDHQYAGAGPYSAVVATCCRSFSEVNNASKSYELSSKVEFTTGNSSPSSTFPVSFNPIRLPASTTASFTVTASDPDGNSTLRYRLATPTEAGDASFVQPPGLTIDNVTGEVSWDNSAVTLGFYSTQIVVEDSDVTAGTLLTSIDVDFLIKVCTSTTDADGDGFSDCDGDCNDSDPNIFPGQTEVCDGIDNNCNGFIDEGFDADGDGFTSCGGDCNDNLVTYEDLDGDGYGSFFPVPCGTVTVSGDCDDSDPAIHPGATDICEDGVDQDCDGIEACPPGNDLCGNAIDIVCGGAESGTDAGATYDSEASCSGYGVWYHWVGTGDSAVFSTCGGFTDHDTYLYIFSGACGSLTCIAQNDDDPSCGAASTVGFQSTAGTDYYIQVAPFGGPLYAGAYTLSLTCITPPPPANDLCDNAIAIACGDALNGTTVHATDDAIAGCGTPVSAPGVWYVYTGTGDIASFTTCGGVTNYDTKISVYSGSCAGLSCVAGNDDNGNLSCGSASPFTSTVSFCATAGATYYVLVNGYSGLTGDFTLSASCTPTNAPAFVAPSPTCGDTIFIGAGIHKTFTVTASDADAADNVTLTVSGQPAGSTLTPAPPTAGNPVSTTFNWTPLMVDIGIYMLTFTATDDCGHQTTCTYPIKVYACKAAVNAGADVNSYYGYPPQQTVTRTAIPSGGPNGTYTYVWTLNRDLMCNVLSNSGDESFTGGTCTNNTCPGTGSIPSANPDPVCSGSNTISAALLAPGTVCVTITDAGGCTASDCFIINAEDVRCFAGNSGPKKVTVCHATGSSTNPFVIICIDKKGVNAHLRANPLDKLGPCPGGAKWAGDEDVTEATGDFSVRVYPNPATNILNVEFGSEVENTYQLSLYDNLGRKVMERNGQAVVDMNKITLPIDDIAVGVYYLTLTVGEELTSVRVAVTR